MTWKLVDRFFNKDTSYKGYSSGIYFIYKKTKYNDHWTLRVNNKIYPRKFVALGSAQDRVDELEEIRQAEKKIAWLEKL